MLSSWAITIYFCIGDKDSSWGRFAVRCVVALSSPHSATFLRINLIDPSTSTGIKHPSFTLARSSIIMSGRNDIPLWVIRRINYWIICVYHEFYRFCTSLLILWFNYASTVILIKKYRPVLHFNKEFALVNTCRHRFLTAEALKLTWGDQFGTPRECLGSMP